MQVYPAYRAIRRLCACVCFLTMDENLQLVCSGLEVCWCRLGYQHPPWVARTEKVGLCIIRATCIETIMKPFYIATVVALSSFSISLAQNLEPHIGLSSQPQPSDSICPIPLAPSFMDNEGYMVGEVVADFTLYSHDGQEVTLSEVLAENKPVLLVGSNYSCWRFRDQIAPINAIVDYYGDLLNAYYVYTVEAHPHIDISPYNGQLWTGQRNFDDGVLIRQAVTYGDRLEAIDEMLENYTPIPQILVDGPCNEFWLNYGQMPNHAYLIDRHGIVQIRQTWVNSPPADLWCELGEYFDDITPNCNDAGVNGSFEVVIDEEAGTVGYGFPGETIIVPVMINNLSETDNVHIEINRTEVYTPDSWQTSLCVDICLAPTVNTTTTVIPPGGSQSFSFYFFTGADGEASGSGIVRFSNAVNSGNIEYVEFSAITLIPTNVDSENQNPLQVYPVPASNMLFLERNGYEPMPWQIFSLSGALIQEGTMVSGRHEIDISNLPAGSYLLRGGSNEQWEVKRFVKM
ncbi:MAG: T9SS C-terminal target domain-containing protein [Cryomorphaceae bacterium]|nr:MAG: T9SS C-terminal target domain-containing protein [Cryomorphaceae bacterium]